MCARKDSMRREFAKFVKTTTIVVASTQIICLLMRKIDVIIVLIWMSFPDTHIESDHTLVFTNV